jgi:hypothetical protein
MNFQLTFQEDVGAPLPDVAAAFNEGMAPAGFTPEIFDVQSWGTGTLAPGNDIGTPGQTARRRRQRQRLQQRPG